MYRKIIIIFVLVVVVVGAFVGFVRYNGIAPQLIIPQFNAHPTVAPETKPPQVGAGCKIGGCSSQLCLDADSGGGVSTCEWREEYACYKSSRCELQANGHCGWTQTNELKSCLNRTQGKSNLLVPIQ